MHMIHPTLSKAAWAAVFTLFAAAATGLQAQQSSATVSDASSTPVPALNLNAALTTPANPFDTESSSSSSTFTTDAVAAERFALSATGEEGMQPPPRRRYGRPRYTDSSHNPDGSSKYTFEIGGGLTLPTGGTHNYAKTSYSFQGGVGRNFNKNVGVLAQFDWDNFGIQTSTLNTLLAEYNREITAYNATSGQAAIALLTQLGGTIHVWSFTLNPIYNLTSGDKLGAYVVGGTGFYHKATSITTPAIGTYCDYYYGCYQYQANSPIDSYISNAIGINGGVGFTYKLSRFANERLFGEVRYVYTANQRRPYYNGVTGTSLTSTYFNVFPQNSAPTTYIPVKFGIRF